MLPGVPPIVGRRIGRGGAGEVREASWPGLGGVAVKILHRAFEGDPAMLVRARIEAAAIARIDHPNVVRLLGTAETKDGRFAIVEPRLVGMTLREVLDENVRLDWPVACRCLAAVLDGLSAAHAVGVVHRDVKPSNLFLGRERGEVRRAARPIVIDFGLARLDGRSSAATTGSTVVGSPAYVAPEQILGGAQDARTDVYAAAVVLYEAIVGVPPFLDRVPARVLEAHLLDEAPRLRAPVPPALARCVARALRKPPRERFDSAAAMAAELRRIVEQDGVGVAR